MSVTTRDELDECLLRIDANNEAEYRAAVKQLHELVANTEKASYNTVFSICHGLDASVLEYIQSKLNERKWRAEIKYTENSGDNDWVSSVIYLAVKTRLTVLQSNEEINVYCSATIIEVSPRLTLSSQRSKQLLHGELAHSHGDEGGVRNSWYGGLCDERSGDGAFS